MTGSAEFIKQCAGLATARDLGAVLRIDPRRVISMMGRIPHGRGEKKRMGFEQLFALYHGRAPTLVDWPPPRKIGNIRGYEWQQPEINQLISLVGVISLDEIAKVLTEQLVERTGDRRAIRSKVSVQNRMRALGLLSTDVVGGITASEAARRIGSYNVINSAIRAGRLGAFTVGRIMVIPWEGWSRFLEERGQVPEGYVRLASIRAALGISSDSKLPEFASAGYIPTAIKIKAHSGPRAASIWYISAETAAKLVHDRRAGLPMPWQGKPLLANMLQSYKRWKQHRHPASCEECKEIWGKPGAPASEADFLARYPGLGSVQKRHITKRWVPGLTLSDVAKTAGVAYSGVLADVRGGQLKAKRVATRYVVTPSEMRRWMRWRARTKPDPMTNMERACSTYLFTAKEMKGLVSRKVVAMTQSEDGRQLVSIVDVVRARNARPIPLERVAIHLGLTLAELQPRIAPYGDTVRKGISLDILRRIKSEGARRKGVTIEAAAERLRKPVKWVQAFIDAGEVHPIQDAAGQVLLTDNSVKRLHSLRHVKPPVSSRPAESGPWLSQMEAAKDGGVCQALIQRFRKQARRRIRTTKVLGKVFLHQEDIRAVVARYWLSERTRTRRDSPPPAWIHQYANQGA